MTSFATTSKTIRLALALTVLTPVPLLAQALTAREMLAQAQNQAVTLPGETKQPGTTAMAKLEVGKEVGKADPARPQPIKAEPPQVELAPPMPIIAPPAPEQPAQAASNLPDSQNRVISESGPAVPVPVAAKPIPAPMVVQAAPSPAVAVAPTPAAMPSPALTSPATAPAPQTEARASQPVPVAPHVRVADTTYAPVPAPAAIQAKSRHEHAAANRPPHEEQTATRHPRGSHAASFNAQMVSQIMQRPEVQSLIAQYGAR